EKHRGRSGHATLEQRIRNTVQKFRIVRIERCRGRLRGKGVPQALAQLAQSIGEMILGQGTHRADLTSKTEVDALYEAAGKESISRHGLTLLLSRRCQEGSSIGASVQ